MLQGQGEPTSGVLGARSVRGNGLAVGLHGQLLEVGGESVEVLVEAMGFQSVSIHHMLVSKNSSVGCQLTEQPGESGPGKSRRTRRRADHQ